MHTADKLAPKAGSLVFKIDLDDPSKDSQDASTFVVIYEGTQVKVQCVTGDLTRRDYDPKEHHSTFTEACQSAYQKLMTKSEDMKTRAASLRAKSKPPAVELEQEKK